MLKPSDHSTSMLFCMNWLNVKLTTAYGIHWYGEYSKSQETQDTTIALSDAKSSRNFASTGCKFKNEV